jgi:hypothetical protein
MVRHLLSGSVYLEMKADRAKKHLEELEGTIREFVKDAYAITRQDYARKRRHVIRFEFKPMPESIAFLAGEFAYALRSGLDQLAWQLALLKTKPKSPRSHTSFPIRSVVPDPSKGFGDATKDILPAAIPVIESFQPYRRGAACKLHPLYRLNELCIIDKHMILPVKASDARIHVSGADFLRRRELDYGFELFFELTDKYKVHLDPIETEIVFGEPIDSFGNIGFEMRLADFTTIYDFYRNEIIPGFEGFFK